MNRIIVSLAIALIAVVLSGPAFPMGGEHPAGFPMGQHPDWPAGLANVLGVPGRVYGYWVNANDWFFYSGDTGDFNRFIMTYAELKDTPLTLVLHTGKGQTGRLGSQEDKIEYDWEVKVFRRGWHPEAPPDPTTEKPGYVVAVEAWLGGEIELSKLSVPLNIKVTSEKKTEQISRFVTEHESRREHPEQKNAQQEPPKEKPKPETVAPENDDREVAKPVGFKSAKPLYARVALNQDGSKILSVVFDESEGTGTGYDVLYADVNFNGGFENGERFEKAPPPNVQSTGLIPPGWSSNTFQPITVNVPFNEKAQNIANPCQIVFTHQRYQVFPRGPFITSFGVRSDELTEVLQVIERVGPKKAVAAENYRLRSAGQPQMREDFSVRALIRLRQDSPTGQPGVWQYSFDGKIQPSESLESAPVWRFDAKPELTVSTRPDGRNEGNLGIGLELKAGDRQFECNKDGAPPKPHVEIRKPDGVVAHEGDDDLGKFRFG